MQFTQTKIPRRLLNYATVFVCGVWVCAFIFSSYRWGGLGEEEWEKQTWTGSLGKLWSLWPLRVNYVSGGNLLIWLQNTALAPVLAPLLHSGVQTELWTPDPTAHLGPHEIHYLFEKQIDNRWFRINVATARMLQYPFVRPENLEHHSRSTNYTILVDMIEQSILLWHHAE